MNYEQIYFLNEGKEFIEFVIEKIVKLIENRQNDTIFSINNVMSAIFSYLVDKDNTNSIPYEKHEKILELILIYFDNFYFTKSNDQNVNIKTKIEFSIKAFNDLIKIVGQIDKNRNGKYINMISLIYTFIISIIFKDYSENSELNFSSSDDKSNETDKMLKGLFYDKICKVYIYYLNLDSRKF